MSTKTKPETVSKDDLFRFINRRISLRNSQYANATQTRILQIEAAMEELEALMREIK